ncbi:MAG TPA: hypothetical protein VKV34_03855 [Thermoleophilia bacterium]|nr:hypothetical protein [Thermoleophilia bacterium]
MAAPGTYGRYGPPPPAQAWWTPPPLPYDGRRGTPPLGIHPMSPVDILDGAFALLKANARKLFLVVAAFGVPVQLVSAFVSRNVLNGQSLFSVFSNPSVFQSSAQSGGGPSAGVRILLQLLSWAGLAVAGGAISRIVGATYLGADETAESGLRTAATRSVALIVAAIIVHIVEGVGFVLVVVPGLMAMAASVAVSPAIVIERLGPLAGVRRSWNLMAPQLWRTIGTLLLTGIVASVLGYSLGLLPLAVLALVGTGHWGWLLLATSNILASFVSWTLAGSVATLFYFDARIRQEGLDLQLLADDLQRGEVRR